MPTFESTLNGNYIIRASIPGTNNIGTWQVCGGGVTLLNQRGVYVGENFDQSLFQELKQRNLVFTGGSGFQKGLVAPTHTAATKEPRKMQSKGTKIRNFVSMVVKRKENSWELLLAFSELPSEWIGEVVTKSLITTLEACRLRVDGDGATEYLPAMRILPGRGETLLEVTPHEGTYTVTSTGTWPSDFDLYSWTQEIKGLHPAGTFFKKNQGGIRLSVDEHLLGGQSYYLVFHKAEVSRAMPIPRRVKANSLGCRGLWEAWEITMPNVVDLSIHNWCTNMGQTIGNLYR